MPDKKITKKTKISDIMKKIPGAAELLFEKGLGCIGCPMAMMETLEHGCKIHGMSDKEINEILKELNKKKK